MKITIEVHKALTAREIINNYEEHKDYFNDKKNSQGVYFHLYGDSTIPFYIGISDNMLRRNRDHIALYRKDYDEYGDRYWLPKEPDRLKNAECYINYTCEKSTDFYSPSRPCDITGRNEAIKMLLDNMSVVFARIVCSDNDAISDMDKRFLLEEVER